jgi:SAM-dependent methyltransferase
VIATERLRELLACPACRAGLQFGGGEAVCARCGTTYPRVGSGWRFAGHGTPSRPGMDLAQRFTGRAGRWEATLLGRLYRALYVHPARYTGDLQRATGLRNYHRTLERFLAGHAPDAVILDVGSGPRRLGPSVVRLDLDLDCDPDLVADAHRLPLAEAVCDGAVVQEVLEHTEEPARVLDEVRRVLRPGGRLYCEVPFLYPVHHRQDFHRWTMAGLEVACAAFDREETGVVIGPFAALSAALRSALTHRCRSLPVEAALDLAVGWATAPLKWIDALLPPSATSTIGAGAVYFVGRRR